MTATIPTSDHDEVISRAIKTQLSFVPSSGSDRNRIAHYAVTEAIHHADTQTLLARHHAEREEADPTRFFDYYHDEAI